MMNLPPEYERAQREHEELIAENQKLKTEIAKTKKDMETLACERNEARNYLAQMKSTLSDTQQTLRAVQEDRDEFAAKMNDAVERADQLQSRCGDLEQDVARLTEEKKWHLDEICGLNGQIEAFRFVVEHWRGGGT